MVKRLVGILALVILGAGLVAVPAYAAGNAADFVTMTGTGDYVLGENAYTWRDGDGSIGITGSVNTDLTVAVSGGDSGKSFWLNFEPPSGTSLTDGVYASTQRFGGAGHAGLDIWGGSRGCNTTTGQFTVHDIAPDLSRLWISYEGHCEGQGPAIFGEIHVGEPTPPNGLLVAPGTVPWPSQAARTTQSAPVTLVNTGSTPITVASATVVGGQGAFAVTSSGCGDLPAGSACQLQVSFTPHDPGTYDATLSIADSTSAGTESVPLSGTAFAVPVSAIITTDQSSYAYGQMAQVTVTMSGTYTNPSVSIYQQAGSGSPQLVTTEGVNGQGQAIASVPVKVDTTFSVQWTDGAQSGAAATSIGVVPITESITTDRQTYVAGDTAKVTVRLSGAYPNPTISLYRRSGQGNGILLGTSSVDSSGQVTFAPKVQVNTIFRAVWTDPGQPPVVAEILVDAHVRLTESMVRSAGHSGRYAVYRPRHRVYILTTIGPNKANHCVGFDAQIFLKGQWLDLATTFNCARVSSSSVAGAYLNYRRFLLGHPMRFRCGFGGDNANIFTEGVWKYAIYRR